MFARITTFQTAGPSPHWQPELFHRLTARVLEVMPKMDGHKGGYFFIDRQSGKAITITLWESEEAMQSTEEAVRPLRKELAEGLSGNIVDVEHFEVGENLVQEIHERELVEQELRVARSIQHASLPRACYGRGRKSHRNAGSRVGLVPSRSLFSAFLSRF